MGPTNKSLSKNKPIVIGLTGGIGAGKTVIARIFSSLGIPVFNSDDEGKRLLAEDEPTRQRVTELFGERAYVQGRPDRKFLAEVVFADEEKRNQLNSIIHPAVRQSFSQFVRQNTQAPFIVNEAAILIETGAYKDLDALILVTAPDDLRIARVRERDGVSSESVKQRMEAQWPQEKKKDFAEFIIENDGKKPVLPAVLQIFNTLKRVAEE